jgi:hypothetical protein
LSPYDEDYCFFENTNGATRFVLPSSWKEDGSFKDSIGPENSLSEQQKYRPGRVRRNYEEDAKRAAKGLGVVRHGLKLFGLGN